MHPLAQGLQASKPLEYLLRRRGPVIPASRGVLPKSSICPFLVSFFDKPSTRGPRTPGLCLGHSGNSLEEDSSSPQKTDTGSHQQIKNFCHPALSCLETQLLAPAPNLLVMHTLRPWHILLCASAWLPSPKLGCWGDENEHSSQFPRGAAPPLISGYFFCTE